MDIIAQIVGRCHAIDSNRQVIREVVSRMNEGYRTFKAQPREERRRMMRHIITTHQANRDLYLRVIM